jgi:hypothetical protein
MTPTKEATMVKRVGLSSQRQRRYDTKTGNKGRNKEEEKQKKNQRNVERKHALVSSHVILQTYELNIADFARSEVFTAVTMTVTLFRHIASCSLVRVSLAETCCFNLQERREN